MRRAVATETVALEHKLLPSRTLTEQYGVAMWL